ncbi:MAG: MotA/TolQ/ExbB proton channel family protein [Candidatus Puniceispirillaceae bacterium]
MTDPRRYLIRMMLFLVIVALVVGILIKPLTSAFMGNAALNSLIIAVALIGIIYVILQVLRLVPEVRWLSDIQRTRTLNPNAQKPVLLATVNVMLADARSDSRLSALSLRSVLDGVAGRLDEGREISRYIIGLLVFLGLLGTFWGLLQTIGSVSSVVSGLDLVNSDFEALMKQLRSGLDAPLSGMATAFSSSLFGLAGSLVLGFLDLQLGQAIGRFFNEVEDWLSAFAKYNDPAGQQQSGTSSLSQGMSEEASRALITLAGAINASETDRQQMLEQVSKMNQNMHQLSELLADDRRLREQLAALQATMGDIATQIALSRAEHHNELRAEIRALSTSLSRDGLQPELRAKKD